MPRTVGRVRPSRTMSLVAGVVGVGVALAAGGSGAPGFFVLVVLLMSGINLFNALSSRGIATETVEFETDEERPPRSNAGTRYCRSCGAATKRDDRFCGDCGARLSEPANGL